MTPTIQNHYSPVFSNKPWSDKHGRIIRFTRGIDSSLIRGQTGPREWGCEAHLYPQDIEDRLAKIEDRVARIYRKLLTNERLTVKERFAWSRWLLCQFARTPARVLELAGFEEHVLSQFPGFSYELTAAEIDQRIEAAVHNILPFSESEKLIPYFVLRDWLILHPAEGECFVKGDNPVVLRGALVDDDATVIYPMGPHACFMATVLGGFPPHQIQGSIMLRPGDAAYYVKVVAACAEREIVCHPESCPSDKLLNELGGILGSSPRFLAVGSFDDW